MKTLSTALTITVLAALFLAAPAALAADGQEVFMGERCNMCHGVAAADIEAKTSSEKMLGPDLSGYQPSVDFETVAAYLRKEGELESGKHKGNFKGTDEELQTLLDWLGSLEAPGGE